MTITTLASLIISLLIAGGLAYFQYIFKAKNDSRLNLFLAFLRFVAVFCLLLLLINPEITRKKYVITKPPLILAVDNSSSIAFLESDKMALNIYQTLLKHKELNEKFDIKAFQFDQNIQLAKKMSFDGKQSNLDLVGKSISSMFKHISYPIVLLTDGNQTSGTNYVYQFDPENKVYPVVLGDTTQFFDLKIDLINVNKYAFEKNKFPVEVFLQANGNKTEEANFTIAQKDKIIFREKVRFSEKNNLIVKHFLLPADAVGKQVYTANITSSRAEKNSFNNTKKFAVDVLNQKVTVVIVSTINHPDIAAFKRAIESNAQRKVILVRPEDLKNISQADVVLYYQPNASFKTLFTDVMISKINSLMITGAHTDFGFLNQVQQDFEFRMSDQSEDYFSEFDEQFNLYTQDNIGFEKWAPLYNKYGTIGSKGNLQSLLDSRIRNVSTKSPLLAIGENSGKRLAYLFGENSWRWRMQSHIETGSFDKYDQFVDKLIQYLATSVPRKSLVVSHESFYNSGESIQIDAQYFNKNFEVDDRAKLSIQVINEVTKKTINYDLLKKGNTFAVDLSSLPAGHYNFTVTELNSKSKYQARFEILDFEIEKQFVNPDLIKLQQLAESTGGKVIFENQTQALIKSLLDNEEYKATEKPISTQISLVEWYWLLIIIILVLATEWFVRKYNGLL